MNIKEAVELYNDTNKNIAMLDHISNNLNTERVSLLSDVELSLVRALVYRRKNELESKLRQTFK